MEEKLVMKEKEDGGKEREKKTRKKKKQNFNWSQIIDLQLLLYLHCKMGAYKKG